MPGVFQMMNFWNRGGPSSYRNRAETQRICQAEAAHIGLSMLPPRVPEGWFLSPAAPASTAEDPHLAVARSKWFMATCSLEN